MKKIAYLIAFVFIFSARYTHSQVKFTYKTVPNKYVSDINIGFTAIPKGAVDLTRLLPKGYVKDGTVDYTKYIQDGIERFRVVVMPNFPVLISDIGLHLKSNSDIYFNINSKLIMKASAKGTDSNTDVYQMMLLDKVSNVKIFNANLVGDRKNHKGSKGEWGQGINILSSSEITISNARISNFWGDGICIGRNKKLRDAKGFYVPSTRVLIEKSVIDYNRRNGISLTCGKDIRVENVILSNQYGTLPMSGIDIEPNLPIDVIDNILFKDVVTFNNAQDGLLLVLTRLSSKDRINNSNIKIINHIDDSSYAAFRIGSGFPKGNKPLNGQVWVENSLWINSLGLRYRQFYEQLPQTTFKGIKIVNPKKLKAAEKYNASGDDIYLKGLLSREKNIKIKDIRK